jgi:hypothetical protein
VDHLVVDGDLEGRPPPVLQIDAHIAREPVRDRLPETSGLGEIVSNGAVLDRDHVDSVVSGAAASPLQAAGIDLTRLRGLRRIKRGLVLADPVGLLGRRCFEATVTHVPRAREDLVEAAAHAVAGSPGSGAGDRGDRARRNREAARRHGELLLLQMDARSQPCRLVRTDRVEGAASTVKVGSTPSEVRIFEAPIPATESAPRAANPVGVAEPPTKRPAGSAAAADEQPREGPPLPSNWATCVLVPWPGYVVTRRAVIPPLPPPEEEPPARRSPAGHSTQGESKPFRWPSRPGLATLFFAKGVACHASNHDARNLLVPIDGHGRRRPRDWRGLHPRRGR